MMIWNCFDIYCSQITKTLGMVFYPRDVVSAVLATGTWLGGWMSHTDIVSKQLNLSYNFFNHLVAHLF